MVQTTFLPFVGDPSPDLDQQQPDGRGLSPEIERLLGIRIAHGRMAVHALRRRPNMPKRERRRLEEIVDQADRAMWLLVMGNRALAVYAAHRYQRGSGSMQDAIQDALIGVVKAAKNFRPETNVPFSSYAMFWIRHELRRAALLRESIRVPTYVKELHIQEILDDASLSDDQAAHCIQQALQSSPSVSARRYAHRFTADRVRSIRLARTPSVSIHEHEEGGAHSVEDEAIRRLESEAIRAALHRLDPQEKEVVVRRFFYDQTVTSIAERMALSPLTVRSLLNKALTRLRKSPELRSIRDDL
jgi:RNA polymerase sigma factor (sigma-70 family)